MWKPTTMLARVLRDEVPPMLTRCCKRCTATPNPRHWTNPLHLVTKRTAMYNWLHKAPAIIPSIV